MSTELLFTLAVNVHVHDTYVNLYLTPGLYNRIEIWIWVVMGIVLAIVGLRRKGVIRRDYLIASATLLAFGISDAFEAGTYNEWWRPWWLLLWKATCVAIVLVLLWTAWRRRARSRIAS